MNYGCIGEHLSHSFSKEIHNALADYEYEIKELTPEELPVFMAKKDFKAINVTIPYKKDVIPYLYWISPEAKSIDAVNTIVNVDGKLYGYNTDYYGMKALIEREGVSLEGKKVAVLGSGGTSNTAFAVAKDTGADSVIKVSRTPKNGYVTYDELYEVSSDIQIIINTTPCGMYPRIGEAAIDIAKFPKAEAVFDAVYNPLKSKLVYDAMKKGIVATGGLYMLVSQAAYAVEKFIDAPVDEDKVEKIFCKLYKDKMNIVLIGMPSCGKSSVGKTVSKMVGKSFVDADEEIVKTEGRAISDIFSIDGEGYFRAAEKKIISDLAMINSHVIATGGGAVLDRDNMDILKENGRVYFINRPLNELISTDDRPLSNSRESLEKRYNERYSLYISSADVVIDGSGSVEEVAKRIEADFIEYLCD